MPEDVSEVFAKLKQGSAPPAAVPPKPAPKPAAKQIGEDVSAVFARRPKPPSVKQKVGAAAERITDVAKHAYTDTVQPAVYDAVRQIYSALDTLKEDIKEPGAEAMPLHGLKTAWDALGAVWQPGVAAVDVAFTQPVQRVQQQVGDFLKKFFPEGKASQKGWQVHKGDVQLQIDTLKEGTADAVAALEMLFGAKGGAGEFVPERAAANARTALQDLQKAAAPPEPKLTPVTASLDHTMGFQGVHDAIVPNLRARVTGGITAPVSAAGLIDDMLPHSEGYARGFLERLREHIDPAVTINFGRTAGLNPETLGVYYPELHKIEVGTSHDDIIHTIVHETAHSTTLYMIDTLVEGDLNAMKAELGRELTPAEKLRLINNPRSPILRELDQVIKEAKIRAQKAGVDFYGLRGSSWSKRDIPDPLQMLSLNRMSPRYEFVAELFSNPKFQEFLANSEKYRSAGYRWKNMLNQLGNLIGRHLGMDKPHELQLLNQAMSVGSRLMRMQGKEKPPTMRGIQDIVGTVDGETVTRGDVQRATGAPPIGIGRLVEKGSVDRAKTSLQISIEQLLRGISPESLGRNAKLAAASIGSRITELMQKESAWRYGSRTRQTFWRARPDLTRQFIDKFEKGEQFSDPSLRDLAKKYRDWGQRIAAGDAKLGFDYEPRDNYLYHIFEDSEGVENYFNRKYGSKWGDPRFIKDRSFDLYKEAVAAGFRPRFDNPEDIMLARQHASDIAGMHIGILNDLASYGLATRKIEGGEKIVKKMDAEGKMQFEIEKTEGNKQPANTTRWRAPNGDVFWVDSQADVILHNAFRSKSLWSDKGALGSAFKGMMSIKNALVPIRLALSLFHPLHVAGIDIAAGWTRAATGLLSGTKSGLAFVGEVIRSGFGPLFENPKTGWRVIKAWQGRIAADKLTEADAEALKTLIEMGMPPEMSSQYRSNARQNFMNALTDARANFRQARPGGAAGDLTRATWHLPWAMLSALGKPIFEVWIPALKAASALKDAKNLLERNPELAENDAARHIAMRKLGKSVENRYGEMNYSTLFWKRWIKDLAVLNTLSLGWQLGFIREYGGGAMDAGQWIAGSDKLNMIRKGQLDRPIFVASYTTLGAAVAGLMTYGMTGQTPSSILDYISPRTGEKNPDGSDQRVSTMFYSREFASLYKHIQNEGLVPGVSDLVLNKGSGLFGLMHEWATGVNGWGQEIRDPDGDLFQKVEQSAAYSMADVEPISMRSIQESVSEKPLKAGVLTAMGFTPAPKYLTESKTTAAIKAAYINYVAPKETPFEKAEYSKDYTALRETYQSGSDKYGDLMGKMVDQFQLSGKDQRRLIRSLNSNLPAATRMFMRLPWQEQIKVLNHATQEEADALLPHANREHVRNVWVPPQK